MSSTKIICRHIFIFFDRHVAPADVLAKDKKHHETVPVKNDGCKNASNIKMIERRLNGVIACA
ncbi:MAG: hypothetical protein ACTSRA_10400 [Promethearchaeota archaeon]